jgi:hypothetical protein
VHTHHGFSIYLEEHNIVRSLNSSGTIIIMLTESLTRFVDSLRPEPISTSHKPFRVLISCSGFLSKGPFTGFMMSVPNHATFKVDTFPFNFLVSSNLAGTHPKGCYSESKETDTIDIGILQIPNCTGGDTI